MANPSTGEKATSTTQSNSSTSSSHTSGTIGSSMRDSSSIARDSMSNIRDTARDASSTARDTMRNVRDTANRMTDKLSDRMNSEDMHEAREMMNRAGEQATEFYDNAQGWMRDNSRMLYMVGGFLAVGIVGYMVGRTFMGRSEIDNY